MSTAESGEAAAAAIAALNGKPAPGARTMVPMRVEYAKKKSEMKGSSSRGASTMSRPSVPYGGYSSMAYPPVSSAPPAQSSYNEKLMQKNIYIAQLPPELTREQLQQMFSPFGTILECNVLKDASTGLGRGVGFIHFSSRDEALLAIQKMNNHQIPGHPRQLRVKFARDTKGTRDLGGGSRGGYASGGGHTSNWSHHYPQPSAPAQGYSGYPHPYENAYPAPSSSYPPVASSSYPPPSTSYPPASYPYTAGPPPAPHAQAAYPPPQSYPPQQYNPQSYYSWPAGRQ